jgi:hypothetical protein
MGQTIQERQLKVLSRCDAAALLQQFENHGCAEGTQGHASYAQLQKAYNRNISGRLLDEAINDFRFVFKARIGETSNIARRRYHTGSRRA